MIKKSPSTEEVNYRPPLLNGFIIVTLSIIIISLAYLGNYYFNGPTIRKITWYALPVNCAFEQNFCQVTLGNFGTIALKTEYTHKEVSLWVKSQSFTNDMMEVRLRQQADNIVVNKQKTASANQHHFLFNLPYEYCLSHKTIAWQLELIIQIDRQKIGTWYNFVSKCE